MWFLWVVAAIVLAGTVYALGVRDRIKKKAEAGSERAKRFLAAVEPFEIFLFKKSQTILKARLQMFVGLLLTMLTQLGTIDLTPLMPFVPDQYEPLVKLAFNMLPLILTGLGWVDERLRYTNTKPVELVALPDAVAAKMPAVVEAEEKKVEAVAAVAEAKAEGAV